MNLRIAGFFAIALASSYALVAFGSGGSDRGRGIRLLSGPEKATIVAADGPAPAPCYNLINGPCNIFDSAGNLTGCSTCSYPNCDGNTDYSCGTSYGTWECPQPDTGGQLAQCPNLPFGNAVQTCGTETMGGTCIGYGNICVSVNGLDLDPPMSCGKTHNSPFPFKAVTCPNGQGQN